MEELKRKSMVKGYAKKRLVCERCKKYFLKTVYVEDMDKVKGIRWVKVGFVCLNCGFFKPLF